MQVSVKKHGHAVLVHISADLYAYPRMYSNTDEIVQDILDDMRPAILEKMQEALKCHAG